MTRRMVSAGFTLVTLAFAASSAAQVSPGRIDASFERLTGERVAGVAVEIDGPQKQSAVTDAAGDVRFLNLEPGTYTMRTSRAGFSDYLNKHVFVGTGRSVRLAVTMYPEGVARQVQVSREAPVVDARNMTASTNIAVAELQDIPSSRDPWVISSLDVRVEKGVEFKGADIRFDLDVFNMFGKRTVLARQYNLRLSGFDEPLETMNPRLLRLGARITF